MQENNIQLMHGDCLELMANIPDGSVDMILADLPYGIVSQEWDCLINTGLLWEKYKRIIKKNGCIALFGVQPFCSLLISGNIKWFKYELIWEKGRASGHVHAKNKPLRAHENVLIFSNGTTVHANQSANRMTYNPQFQAGERYKRVITDSNKNGKLCHKASKANIEYTGTVINNDGTRYPRTVLRFKNHNVGTVHPTQKPVALLEYLIKTYTNEGETVLDNVMGSGSTGVAAINTGRKFIGIEKDDKYFEIGSKRINEHLQQNLSS